MLRGTVHETGGGVYRVALEDGTVVVASIRGRVKREGRTGDRVVIGDRVLLESPGEEIFTIEDVEPRDTVITRRGPGGRRPKVVAANVERMIIVVAAADPAPHPTAIDRLLVIAESNGVAPVLVVNKVDLPGTEAVVAELGALYRGPGYPVLAVSAREGTNLDGLAGVVCRGTSALVGPS